MSLTRRILLKLAGTAPLVWTAPVIAQIKVPPHAESSPKPKPEQDD